MAMDLPDEAIVYNYQSLLVPAGEDWTAAAELRARHAAPDSSGNRASQRHFLAFG